MTVTHKVGSHVILERGSMQSSTRIGRRLLLFARNRYGMVLLFSKCREVQETRFTKFSPENI